MASNGCKGIYQRISENVQNVTEVSVEDKIDDAPIIIEAEE